MKRGRLLTLPEYSLILAVGWSLVSVIPQGVNVTESGEPSTSSSAAVQPVYGLQVLSSHANREDRDAAGQFGSSAGHWLFFTANGIVRTVQVPAEHQVGSPAWDQLLPTTSSMIQAEGDNTAEVDGREDFVLALTYDPAMK